MASWFCPASSLRSCQTSLLTTHRSWPGAQSARPALAPFFQTVTEQTDLSLVRACRDGDQAAWSDLVARYAPLIQSVPRRYGLDRTGVEEVFAEVCVVLVRSLESLRDVQAFPAWLIRVSTRATWEQARKTKRALTQELPELTGAGPSDELVEALEEEELVRRALQRISDRCRRLLELLYFQSEALSYDDVALRLGVPRGSLGPTRQRCLDRMRAALPSQLGGHVSKTENGPPEG